MTSEKILRRINIGKGRKYGRGGVRRIHGWCG